MFASRSGCGFVKNRDKADIILNLNGRDKIDSLDLFILIIILTNI